MSKTIDWNVLKEQLAAQAVDSLRGLIQGAAEDIQQFGMAIASDQVAVLQHPDATRREELRTELVGQLRTLAEINRVRANQEAWNQVVVVVDTVTATALRVLPAVVAAI